MKRILSYFIIFLINFIACTYLQGSDPDFRPPAPPPSPVDMTLTHSDERPLIRRELSTPHNPSEGEHGSEVVTESAASDISSEHQERINELRKKSKISNKPARLKTLPRSPHSDPWHCKLAKQHLEYAGGAITAISLAALLMTHSNDSQSMRSGIPTDAIAIGYQVGTTALSILGGLGLKGIVCAGGLYGVYKIKRWIHAGCRSDLQKTKDEFEKLLNEHIQEDNDRLIEAAKKDDDMCNAFDGLVTAITLMNQHETRTITMLIKMSQTLSKEQQTLFLRMLTPDEQILFNAQVNNPTDRQLDQAQSHHITGLLPRLIATKPTNQLPNSIAIEEAAEITQILRGVQNITKDIHKETQHKPLPQKTPQKKICSKGCSCC